MNQQKRTLRSSLWRSLLRHEQEDGAGKEKTSSSSPMRPQGNNPDEWRAYWQAQQQPWRTEPEISPERQMVLKRCRETPANPKNVIYPFKGIKLDRAEVEWLLATHENGCGPVLWSDEHQREGLDLRSADLSGEETTRVDLHGLPLARLIGDSLSLRGANLSGAQLQRANLFGAQLQRAILFGTQLQRANLSGAQLQATNLSGAQLDEASLYKAQLDRASLIEAQLEKANLTEARLEKANLTEAQLQEASLSGAQLQGAILYKAQLQRANLRGVQLQGAYLSEAQLEKANLIGAQLQGAILRGAQLQGVSLYGVQLEGADLRRAQLQGANLYKAQLQGTDLAEAQLQGADLRKAQLQGANLCRVQLQGANLHEANLEDANLSEAQLDGVKLANTLLCGKERVGPFLADVQWGSTNLAVVEWSQIDQLGEEHRARQEKEGENGPKRDTRTRLREYLEATRANRQLAVALQGQGLTEDAGRFAYRANVLQRKVLWYQTFGRSQGEKEQAKKKWYESAKNGFSFLDQRARRFGSFCFLLFLDVLAGHGYKSGRSIRWYLLVVFGFAFSYTFVGHWPFWPDALVYSLTSFHGRGFLPGINGQTLSLHHPLVVMAAFEAVAGLLVEISFIATFTQRYFGK